MWNEHINGFGLDLINKIMLPIVNFVIHCFLIFRSMTAVNKYVNDWSSRLPGWTLHRAVRWPIELVRIKQSSFPIFDKNGRTIFDHSCKFNTCRNTYDDHDQSGNWIYHSKWQHYTTSCICFSVISLSIKLVLCTNWHTSDFTFKFVTNFDHHYGYADTKVCSACRSPNILIATLHYSATVCATKLRHFGLSRGRSA